MDQAAQVLGTVAHEVYVRAEAENNKNEQRPPVFKAIGISLAVGSGLFIGTSFVLKKMGLLKANEKYNEVAGEGYGYLKNAFWWAGMTLMILGEVLNFVAYAFTDAILVTPLGALSVVITTVLSAIFLKERLSMVGKVACFLCIVGSVVIVMNAPQESSVANIQEMQRFVITPGFLSYTGVVVLGSVVAALYAGPRWGKKNMLVYISICSWIGGLSVVTIQGLGAAIVAQIGGTPQFNQWFIYVLLVFVIATLVTEIIYLNKALNLFNAALVTPTYYVYFTSTTIITSAVLFQGFKGTPTSIVTVVMGFLTICSGVVLLQLSKSAKDVPDTAVFAGDLNQIHTIAEQEQSETEPKADAIRGAAALVRRFSSARQQMEMDELRRLRDEKARDALEPVSEDGQPVYEWDGLRRRRTTLYSTHGSQRSRAATSPNPFTPAPPTPHPPLGMSHFPTQEELAAHDRPMSPGALSSIVGTIRSRTRSILTTEQHLPQNQPQQPGVAGKSQSPMHPVQLTEIAVAGHKTDRDESSLFGRYGIRPGGTAYEGGRKASPLSESSSQFPPPTPPPHGVIGGASARRQFSFQNVFRRHQQHEQQTPPTPSGPFGGGAASSSRRPGISSSRGYSSPHVKGATEEETLGLVTGDSQSQSMPALQQYASDDDDNEDPAPYVDDKEMRYGRGITNSPPRWGAGSSEKPAASEAGPSRDGSRGRGAEESDSGRPSTPPQAPPPQGYRRHTPPEGGNGGAFI